LVGRARKVNPWWEGAFFAKIDIRGYHGTIVLFIVTLLIEVFYVRKSANSLG
jgi:hypothetical protein